MDEAQQPVNGAVGISVRNGPVEEMDVDEPQANGNASSKRKGRASTGKSYKASSDELDDDAPLVSLGCPKLRVSIRF